MQRNISVLRTEFGLNPAQHLENHVLFYLYDTDTLRDALAQNNAVVNGIVNVSEVLKNLKKKELTASSEIEESLSIEDFNIGGR